MIAIHNSRQKELEVLAAESLASDRVDLLTRGSIRLRYRHLANQGNRVEDEKMGESLPEVGPGGGRLVHQVEEVVIPRHEIPRSGGDGAVDLGLIIRVSGIGKYLGNLRDEFSVVPQSAEKRIRNLGCQSLELPLEFG